MKSNVVEIRQYVKLECSSCGASAEGSCNCGVAYVPKSVRIADAVDANPGKTSRAIAAEIGVSHTAVDNARRAVGNNLPPDTRTGRDGKQYPSRPRREDGYDDDGEITNDESSILAFVLRAGEALQYAVHAGPVDQRVVDAASQTAEAWSALANKLRSKLQ